MNIPPKYEDVVAQLETERARITDYISHRAQTELLLEAALAREAALREELAKLADDYCGKVDDLVELQHRLTVAEQRAGELLIMLRMAWGYDHVSAEDCRRIDAALKPAAEGEGS